MTTNRPSLLAATRSPFAVQDSSTCPSPRVAVKSAGTAGAVRSAGVALAVAAPERLPCASTATNA